MNGNPVTARKTKIISAVARLDKPRKPTKARRIAQQRQATAWRNVSKEHGGAADTARGRTYEHH